MPAPSRYPADVHPLEQLRAVARAGPVDAVALTLEAADALAALAREPRALVPACRRLVDAQPAAGPLWWLCAEVLAAVDPAAAAGRVADALLTDETAEVLAGALPGATAVAADVASAIVDALAARPDVDARLIGEPRALRGALRRIAGGAEGGAHATGAPLNAAAEMLAGTTCALIEVDAAGPSGVLVARSGATLADAAAAASVPIWAVCGVGRVLPGPLFDAACRRAGGHVVATTALAVVIGPDGPRRPDVALAAGGRSVPNELLARPNER